ncbi:MAG: ABC transporter ATP-binding protein [Lachnospiraceae bacterium]|nr:ABC transporter ATP-binding protein [Lachnospiraceae bacterium]
MSDKKIVIDVKDLTIRFNRASQQINNLKEYVIKMLKHELMFQEFLALQDISFQVQAGESWGIIGANGSGKSTLLKTISGILKPYKGSVYVNGKVAPLIELGAGFDGEMTARENVILNGTLMGYSMKFMLEKFDEIIEFSELQDFLDMPIKNYSSGMAARLGFAVATMVKPDILICDEVLSVGDYKFQEKCEQRMKEMLANGTTLLYVSHSVQSVENICDHALWLDRGQLKMSGEVHEVCRAYMGDSYTGE